MNDRAKVVGRQDFVFATVLLLTRSYARAGLHFAVPTYRAEQWHLRLLKMGAKLPTPAYRVN